MVPSSRFNIYGVLTYKENSSEKTAQLLLLFLISPCPAVSQSESRSHLVSYMKYIKRHEFSRALLTIQATVLFLSYNLNCLPFQNWVSLLSAIPSRLFPESSLPSTLQVSVLCREGRIPRDFYFLEWLGCPYNKLLLRTLQHKASTYRRMDSLPS